MEQQLREGRVMELQPEQRYSPSRWIEGCVSRLWGTVSTPLLAVNKCVVSLVSLQAMVMAHKGTRICTYARHIHTHKCARSMHTTSAHTLAHTCWITVSYPNQYSYSTLGVIW